VTKRILIIQGHPDPSEPHLGHALARAYAEGAESAGHEVRHIVVGELDFPILASQRAWYEEAPPAIVDAQASVVWADHLVLFYPLWLGTMPALLKGFLEQLFRPGFAFFQEKPGTVGKKALTGKSARIVITMGMPALVYRWYFRAHSLKSLERNILRFVGIGPIRTSLFGLVEAVTDARRGKWIGQVHKLGAEGR
jgi:putative NADPH-quinone reductase